ncbi:MAG: exodeoxyribonuclease VII small subunit [Clostridia bacterium]|nr:exodeoxyribonuclease VII small subunit [Clostridia bacterium]
MAEKKISFEESMVKLEKIADELEGDNLTLDESVKKFEEGMKISKKCKEILDNAEKKITVLVGEVEKDFSINSSTEE